MRWLAAILCIGTTGTAFAVSEWITVATTAEVAREAGVARWTTWTSSATRARCAPPGSAITEGTDNDFFNCLSHSVYLRNESSLPLQCEISLELTAKNHSGAMREKVQLVIYPDTGNRAAAVSVGPSTSQIGSQTTSCVAIPAEPAALPIAAGCQVDVKAHDIEYYYPRKDIRLALEGTVQIEYSTRADGRLLQDVQIVRSSGIETLDSAALRYARGLRARSNCPQQRFRYDIEFKMTPSLMDRHWSMQPQRND